MRSLTGKIEYFLGFLYLLLLFFRSLEKRARNFLSYIKYCFTFSVMKKLALVLAFGVLVFASSCTSYTCPTYSKVDMKKNQPTELDQEKI